MVDINPYFISDDTASGRSCIRCYQPKSYSNQGIPKADRAYRSACGVTELVVISRFDCGPDVDAKITI